MLFINKYTVNKNTSTIYSNRESSQVVKLKKYILYHVEIRGASNIKDTFLIDYF